jgi:hypothetical protein
MTTDYLTTDFKGVLRRPDGRFTAVLNDGRGLGPFQDSLSAALYRDVEFIREHGSERREQLNFPIFSILLNDEVTYGDRRTY